MSSRLHKLWKVTTTTLLLLLTIQFTLMGFFKQKAILHNKTPAFTKYDKNDNKVIILLIDALREDFVDFGANNKLNLKLNSEADYAY